VVRCERKSFRHKRASPQTVTIGIMADHFDRGLGLSDARNERFKGMVW
jgi:hypothetical protein